MKKVLIYVEGQTEETFVRDLLAPYLQQRGLCLVPTLARTKRTKAGQTFKGGIVAYGQIRRDILRLLQDRSAALITTMIDYYGLPDDFPGKASLWVGTPPERVSALERAFAQDIGHPRFHPFLTLHEFESLLFASPDCIVEAFPDCPEAVQLIQQISGKSPEEINEGKETHPAARILKCIPSYRKPLHGPLIASRIGLQNIRARCPHFNEWVQLLENI